MMMVTREGTYRTYPLSSLVLGTVILVLVLSGCRTYGGWDSEEANYAQIVQANLTFTDELTRVQRDVERLREAAMQNEDLGAFVERYDEAMLRHQAMLLEHQRFEEEASRNQDSHRTLHRLLAAIIVDHQLMRDRYERLLQQVYETVDPDEAMVRAVTPQARGHYQIAPPFHQRLDRVEADLTLGDVVGRLGTE